jgi:putative ABC transport system permease protein
LLFVSRLQFAAKESFSGTISKTDLIVGGRGGGINLLLYSIFRIGNATNNISVSSAEWIQKHPAVEWTVPISLGDSFKGFRVVATNSNFFERYKYRSGNALKFEKGSWSTDVLSASLGSHVADKLNLKIGDKISLAHGVSEGPALQEHSDKPFEISGILSETNTPVDKSVYITLEGMEAIHVDWENGIPPALGEEKNINSVTPEMLVPKVITALLVGTKNRIDSLRLQREINTFENEPLMAIIPGVTLNELWSTVEYAEIALQIVSIAVCLVGLVSVLIAVQSSLSSRRREMAILRSLGASARKIFSLFIVESLILSSLGIILGVLLCVCISILSAPLVESYFGLSLPLLGIQSIEFLYIGLTLCLGVLSGFVPAALAYKTTLSDGLSPKI